MRIHLHGKCPLLVLDVRVPLPQPRLRLVTLLLCDYLGRSGSACSSIASLSLHQLFRCSYVSCICNARIMINHLSCNDARMATCFIATLVSPYLKTPSHNLRMADGGAPRMFCCLCISWRCAATLVVLRQGMESPRHVWKPRTTIGNPFQTSTSHRDLWNAIQGTVSNSMEMFPILYALSVMVC